MVKVIYQSQGHVKVKVKTLHPSNFMKSILLRKQVVCTRLKCVLVYSCFWEKSCRISPIITFLMYSCIIVDPNKTDLLKIKRPSPSSRLLFVTLTSWNVIYKENKLITTLNLRVTFKLVSIELHRSMNRPVSVIRWHLVRSLIGWTAFPEGDRWTSLLEWDLNWNLKDIQTTRVEQVKNSTIHHMNYR